MANKKTIPLESINQRLVKMGQDWQASDYFISPDETDNANRETSPYRPNFYILGLCVQGWVEFYVDDKLIKIRPNYFFAAGPQRTIQKANQSPDCKLRYLFFTRDFLLNNMINAYELESFLFFSANVKPYIQLGKKETEPLLQLYDILKNKRNKNNSSHHIEIIRSLFYTFLYEAAAIYQKNNIEQPKFTRDVDLNIKFQQMLAKSDTKKHNLKFYADSLFITPKYLIHAIKKSSGKTPGKLIDEAIIAEAKLLLRDRDQTIAAVSEQLQFSDQTSFSKFFKKNTGITPASYRIGR
jgi:AraC family transcriptional activator of pobA